MQQIEEQKRKSKLPGASLGQLYMISENHDGDSQSNNSVPNLSVIRSNVNSAAALNRSYTVQGASANVLLSTSVHGNIPHRNSMDGLMNEALSAQQDVIKLEE